MKVKVNYPVKIQPGVYHWDDKDVREDLEFILNHPIMDTIEHDLAYHIDTMYIVVNSKDDADRICDLYQSSQDTEHMRIERMMRMAEDQYIGLSSCCQMTMSIPFNPERDGWIIESVQVLRGLRQACKRLNIPYFFMVDEWLDHFGPKIDEFLANE